MPKKGKGKGKRSLGYYEPNIDSVQANDIQEADDITKTKKPRTLLMTANEMFAKKKEANLKKARKAILKQARKDKRANDKATKAMEIWRQKFQGSQAMQTHDSLYLNWNLARPA